MKTVNRGFSLLELMVGVTVVSILMAVAVPSFREFGRSTRVISSTNDLITAFNYARSEAIGRSTPVTICATTDFLTCSSAGYWSTGFMAFVDGSGTQGVLDGTDVRIQSWLGPGATDMTISTSSSFVQFNAMGMVSPSTQSKSFSISPPYCTVGTPQRRTITVSVIGQINTQKQLCYGS